ncbi:Retaining alpha-galactosidase precursor [Sedimentisphaera cyanobacteriorum]|uniref:Retaining alpha-galactosidase n=1 Tax=Sedimentisphaera cyanobacteriorum TaxID=1940790 RepID=A0A1Q2HLF4_9BACT|nr:glycoside hydrolase family 97 protein [Sedimentisphaera cyanobacteriorum]AQQ08297.1 Retaining alpha-galactosidase precursor [Sedimentisphaera cyanobacteriorum]
MKRKNILLAFAAYLFFSSAVFSADSLSSPDGKLEVYFSLNDKNAVSYSVEYAGMEVLEKSDLGLVCEWADFDSFLKLASESDVQQVSQKYKMLHGKKKNCSYKANRKVYTLTTPHNSAIKIEFRVSDNFAAFRYILPDNGKFYSVIKDEKTSFNFPEDTLSWLHPMAEAKTGWEKTQPSYEEHYAAGREAGEDSKYGQGWSMPALFKTADDNWVLLFETDVYSDYCGTRLLKADDKGGFKIGFPQPEEHRGIQDPVSPAVELPFKSPWRVLVVGDNLGAVVESTAAADLASPCRLEDTGFVEPGRAAWHWLRYADSSSTLEYANSFLDFAAKMQWEYMLIDCYWDNNIGYEKMEDFVKKANSRGVKVILWYNSNGFWNEAPLTPKHKMHTRSVRRSEFARLKEMGVAGVKIDFFGGDKQAVMKLYQDILEDAADYGIMVNFHGATVPRGWHRTYPNMLTLESVKGMEYCTFNQGNADAQPQHCCILPFTRNVVGPMDFTPVVFNPEIRSVQLRTTLGFELALSIVFESGIQHFGLVPEEYDLMPDYVVSFLQDVPVSWDQTHFIKGYPGKLAVIARKKGASWYIGGINGEAEKKNISIDLSFVENLKGKSVSVITDGENRSFMHKELQAEGGFEIDLNANGGFAAVVE